MANTDGQIILGLDIPKTVSQINADIKKLQNQLKQVKTTGALDTSSTVKQINAQIAALQSQLKSIDIKANVNTTDAHKTGQKVGQTVTDTIQRTIDSKDINIDKLNADVKTLTNNLNSFSSKNAGFDSFKTEINGVEVSLDSLIGKLSTVDNITDLSTIRSQAAALKTAFTELAQTNKIQLSMDNGHGASEYQNRINSIIASLEKYGIETKEAQAITSSLQSTFDAMKGLSGQELITQADKLEQEFKAVKASVEEAKISYNKFMQPVSNEKATSLINRINTFLTKNTKITKEARVELEGYADELGRGVKLSRWNEINGQLKKLKIPCVDLGNLVHL